MRLGENALSPNGIALLSSGILLLVNEMRLSVDGINRPMDGVIVWMGETGLSFGATVLRLIGVGNRPV